MGRILIHLLVGLALPAIASAQGPSDRWQASVKAALARADTLASQRGYTATRIQLTGTLFIEEGESRILSLPGGETYLIVAVCDEDCRALNLVLSNPNGDQIASYREEGNAPFVEAPNARGGEYQLRVIMRNCRRAPCRYGIAVYEKR